MVLHQERGYVCERVPGCGVLAVAGGICGGYGVICCGHTFPLAQTGNIIGMWETVSGGRWQEAALHLLMLLLYVAGITATVLLPEKLERMGGKRLSYAAVLLAEGLCVAASLFIPESLPGILRVGPLFLLSALQYNTFKSCEGVAAAGLFCTNNIRQMTISFWDWKKDRNPEAAHKMRVYGAMLLCYSAGVLAGCFGAGIGQWVLVPAAAAYLLLAALVAGKKR